MTFIEILILLIVLVLSIIVIRISFKFDINKFIEDRRKIKLNQLKNVCPHTTGIVEGNQIILESLFISPPGTIQWQCQQCGLILGSEIEVQRITNGYQKDPMIILTKQKEFNKKAKKLKLY
jgi:hypothetical protein